MIRHILVNILCAQRGVTVETKLQIYVSSVTEFPGEFYCKTKLVSLSFSHTQKLVPAKTCPDCQSSV